MDLDNTITIESKLPYEQKEPNKAVIDKLHQYKELGFGIAIYTARNMNTYNGNVGLINTNTLPVIIGWLNKHNVPFDEIFVGKPWCGTDGFYVDDKAIRPAEFTELTYEQIRELVK